MSANFGIIEGRGKKLSHFYDRCAELKIEEALFTVGAIEIRAKDP